MSIKSKDVHKKYKVIVIMPIYIKNMLPEYKTDRKVKHDK